MSPESKSGCTATLAHREVPAAVRMTGPRFAQAHRLACVLSSRLPSVRGRSFAILPGRGVDSNRLIGLPFRDLPVRRTIIGLPRLNSIRPGLKRRSWRIPNLLGRISRRSPWGAGVKLGWLDLLVLGTYFAAVLVAGFWFGRTERNTHDYFLGGKRQPWLVVGLSIIATEVSALTFINVPADSFWGDWNYLQMYAGAFVGRMLIVVLLLPAFYGGAVTTVYQYLGQRFGPWTRTTASVMFVGSRVIGSGIRLLAASLAIATVFNWRLEWVIFVAAAIAIAYTTFGGIKAIIWTDALQALVFLGGGVAALVFLFLSTPGTWIETLSNAYEADKFHTFTWGSNLNNEKLFWVLLISATFQNCAALGVDQDLTQRMLTCPDLRRGQRSLIFNAVVGLPVVCLFLLIGTLMSVHFGGVGASSLPPEMAEKSDRVFPYFIAYVLPSGYGLKGLLLAGIFAAAMSSLDSALGALSSTAVTDFYRPFILSRGSRSAGFVVGRESRTASWKAAQAPDSVRADSASDSGDLRVARLYTLAFGVLLAGVALAFAGYDRLLWQTFQWVGLIFGGMLGVFLLGVTTKTRGHDRVNTLAMLSSVVILVAIKLLQEQTGEVRIAWPWWVVIGTGWTYLMGACFRTRRRDALDSLQQAKPACCVATPPRRGGRRVKGDRRLKN